ncbi:hypothetical protein FB567DRAFT_227780 [Paraphoma chrysanthemicola]|uniref:Uncharacterized protein n=1 Tax=Paraphoma chrysanthemicola TaxID=798071 RepID=A0A8K0W2F8_9PLEO|nr:hypothetical protein FB567DRAFT_227780 [Paraphoma chrysanthemicola]
MSLSEQVHLLHDFEYDWNSRDNHFYKLSQRDRTADMFLSQSLLSLLSYFQAKRCSVQRDRAFSLLSLCDTATKIEVDYQARRVDLAAQILELQPNAPCVCSATVVASSLGLHTESGGVPDSAKNSMQPWLDIRFTAMISKSVSNHIDLGYDHQAQYPCSLFVLALAEWLLSVTMGTHKRLLQVVREGKPLPLSSVLHRIGWTQKEWYCPDPSVPGYKMGIYDLDRNTCMLRVALLALIPGSKFPQYPDLCHLHKT